MAPQAPDTIWVHEAPDGLDAIGERVRALWPADANPGTGGRILTLSGAAASFSTAGLGRFASALVGELRYQSCEVFLSPPTPPGTAPSTPVVVAAAFQQTDTRHGEGTGRAARPRGTYTLSDSKLQPLKRLMLAGEPSRYIKERMVSFEESDPEAHEDLPAYVDYAAIGTIVAMLAGPMPSDQSGAGPVLWDIAKEVLDYQAPRGTKGFQRQVVRNAMRCLVHANRDLLLEDDADVDAIRHRAEQIVGDFDFSDATVPGADALDEACDLWMRLSSKQVRIGTQLRKDVWELPSSVVRLLFEAHVRSYPMWLQSATLRVEAKRHPVLHGNLRAAIAGRRGFRNKRVNVVTLDAYERAAGWLLLPDRTNGGTTPALRSMLLFPFEAIHESGLRTHGFVRFMNRFHGSDVDCRLFDYPLVHGRSQYTPEERDLGLAVTEFLGEQVLGEGLFPEVYDREERAREAATYAPSPSTPAVKRRPFKEIVGASDSLQGVLRYIDAYAAQDISVLISGESGTGKELVARALHRRGPRAEGPLVALNCAAITEQLMESELFGIEAGVATDVSARIGKIEAANKGTLFLDEVGDLSPTAQAKILRVLQEREVVSVGSNDPRPVDVRLICATKRDLQRAVTAGQFREDLYYRIRAAQIHLPPLRDRQGDIPRLVEHFLARTRDQRGVTARRLSRECVRFFLEYEWPGNVRELELAIDSAAILCGDGTIELDHLPNDLRASAVEWRGVQSEVPGG